MWLENTLEMSNWSFEKKFNFNEENFKYFSEPSTRDN